MAGNTAAESTRQDNLMATVVSGYAALAESLWMGAAQATEVLEPLNLLRRRLPRPGMRGLLSRQFTIAEASAILMVSFLLSAFLGAVRQILFNVQFGAGSDASAYYAAFRLPDTLFSLIAGGALSSAMIPVLLRTGREDGQDAAWRLVNLVLNTLLAVTALTVVIGEVFAPIFVSHVLAPGFSPATSRLTVTLTRIMLIQPVILAVGSVATAVLNSRNQFLLTAISIASHNIGLIGGILATRLDPSLGIKGPALGVVAGAVLQVLILLPGLLDGSCRYRPLWQPHDGRLREVIGLLIPNGMAVGVLYVGFILDTAFASRAAQTAALPAIQNAFLLVGLPIALLGQAVGQSAFPRLASQAEAGSWALLQQTLLRAFAAAVALSLPALFFLIVAGRRVVHVLFEHGHFGTAAGSLTYGVLVAYAVALPAYIATEVATRGLIALRDTRTPLLTNTMQIVGRGAIMTIIIGRAGALAIPHAFAIMATVEALVLTTVLAVKVRRLAMPAAAPEPSLQSPL